MLIVKKKKLVYVEGCLYSPFGLLEQKTTVWVAYKHRNFSLSSRAGRSKIKAPVDLVSGENALPGS